MYGHTKLVQTFRDKAWILGQCTDIHWYKLLEIKLGFWDNVREYNSKKRLEIKLWFWDNVRTYTGTNF